MPKYREKLHQTTFCLIGTVCLGLLAIFLYTYWWETDAPRLRNNYIR